MISSESEAREYVQKFANSEAMDRFDHLASALVEENSKQNLISKPSEIQIWQRHIADSVQLLRFVPREIWEDGGVNGESAAWLDLGTGAGFPGLVVSIIAPQLSVFLVESRARRVQWLESIAAELGLAQCTTLGQRLELVEPFSASVISARAFAPLQKLLHLSAPFSTSSTRYVLPKGRSAAQELSELPESKRKLFHVEQSMTGSDAGIIVSR